MTSVAECIGLGASYYNLAMVVIVIILFITLFRIKTKQFIFPWKLIFAAVCIYVIEEVLTVLEGLKVLTVPVIIPPILEMAIILLFIYALLSQREFLKGKK